MLDLRLVRGVKRSVSTSCNAMHLLKIITSSLNLFLRVLSRLPDIKKSMLLYVTYVK